MIKQEGISPRVLTALLIVQLLFGINYVASKFVVDAFPPLVWASLRVVISALLMLTVAFFSRRPAPKYSREFFVPMIGYSLLGIILNQSAFLEGLHFTSATNSSVLNTLIPIFTLLIVVIRGQEPLTTTKLVGFVSALLGVLVIRKVEELSFSDRTWVGDLLTVLNCLSYALFLSFSKKFLEKNDPLWVTTWLFIYGSIGVTLISLPQWSGLRVPVLTPTLIACMSFAIIGGTLLAYLLNLWALARTRSSHVALFIYLQPVVASLLVWAWLGETVTPRTIFSAGLIFLGLLLGLSKTPTKNNS